LLTYNPAHTNNSVWEERAKWKRKKNIKERKYCGEDYRAE